MQDISQLNGSHHTNHPTAGADWGTHMSGCGSRIVVGQTVLVVREVG